MLKWMNWHEQVKFHNQFDVCSHQETLRTQPNEKCCTRDDWRLDGIVKRGRLMCGGRSQKVDCGWRWCINNHHAHVQEMGYTCCIPCVKTTIINDKIMCNHSSVYQSLLLRLDLRLRLIWKIHVSKSGVKSTEDRMLLKVQGDTCCTVWWFGSSAISHSY